MDCNYNKDQIVSNRDFICPLCHEHDYTPSEIVLHANYGSIYDGEHIAIQLCGDCFDKFWNKVIPVKGEVQ